MSDNNKNNNKERLEKQSERPVTDITNETRQQEGYTDDMSLDPAQKIAQTGTVKVQNPDRNLARGGNNTNAKHRSG